MAELLPEGWKEPLRRLREDIHGALDRWRRRARRNGDEAGALPVLLKEKMTDLRENVRRAVDRLVPRRANSHWRGHGDLWFPSFFETGGPALDVQETDDEIIVTAEMPGLDKDDFAVEISADRLVLRGEKQRNAEEQGSGYYYAERSFGSFVRVVPLPCEIDTERVKARYRNGLLRIAMPKSENARARRIEVAVR
jgi:HSP20 family protein